MSACWREEPIVMIDVETTGRDPSTDRIIEIAVVSFEVSFEVDDGCVWSSMVRPPIPVPPEATAINGIDDAALITAPTFERISYRLSALVDGRHPAAYNAQFDRAFVLAEYLRAGVEIPQWLRGGPNGTRWIDPLVWVREAQKFQKGKRLEDAARRLGISVEGDLHRATVDAELALRVLNAVGPKDGTLDDLLAKQDLLEAQQQASFKAWRFQEREKERSAHG